MPNSKILIFKNKNNEFYTKKKEIENQKTKAYPKWVDLLEKDIRILIWDKHTVSVWEHSILRLELLSLMSRSDIKIREENGVWSWSSDSG